MNHIHQGTDTINKDLSLIAIILLGIILVALLYQTFLLGHYSTFNFMAILAFAVFLAISIYDWKNADS
ncbi:MAG: hypothetical protein PWQ15_1891 [Methanobacterium sp.]|jgi:hypothetical protein|uniref:hypothetical protein n=1 Tax=Methanobacterium sp. TaxID=2164 RepID=UPI0003C991F8|nr:hypothetical protein [Methanobacterium sp.]MDI3550788.1 hypothetical protein [Methanobacterium sp.]CDG66089.1 putative membrane protein [Methanobacterium sp. MB1]